MAKARLFGEPKDGFVMIKCPGCKTSHIIATVKPFENGAVWAFNNDFDKPTFSPSLLIRTGKYVPGHEDFDDEGFKDMSQRCHSYIRDGKILYLNDCTHELKGQTVELPDVEIKNYSPNSYDSRYKDDGEVHYDNR